MKRSQKETNFDMASAMACGLARQRVCKFVLTLEIIGPMS